jgi:hypothetical protein
MGIAEGLIGGGILGLVGSSMQSNAAENAASMQAGAADRAAQQQRDMFDIQNEQQKPYREAGYGALTNIKDMLPYFTREVTAQDLSNMPGFTFGLKQGVGATREGLNVGGGGSNVTRGATKFATDYATNVGLPQYISQRTGIYNTLANIAGIGQKSQEQSGGIASNIGQLGIGGATALGAGQIGAANAMANAYGGLGSNLMLSQLLTPQGGGFAAGGQTLGAAPTGVGISDYFRPA